jgi:hypothetical protein
MKTTIARIFCCALVSASALLAQPKEPFTKITEGPIVNDTLDTWYAYWGDYDNDGRLDVHLSGMLGHWRIYHNDGGSNFSTVTSGPWGDYASSALWGLWWDPDNDGDLDLSGWNRPSAVNAMFWNDGGGVFTRDNSWLQGADPRSYGGIEALGDFDNDGFIDAFLGAWANDSDALLHNNGDRTFSVVPESVLNIRGDNYIQVGCAVDYDNDGDLDIVLVRYESRPTAFYRNDGSPTSRKRHPNRFSPR